MLPAPSTPARLPVRVFIAMGGNLGDVRASFRRALELLDAVPGFTRGAASSLYRTRPVGPVAQPAFLNAVVEARTLLEPGALLRVLQAVERALGRDRAREQRWGPRTLDLDLLLYGQEMLNLPGLTAPHPRLAERRFVLAPLVELESSLPVPGLAATAGELLAALPVEDGGGGGVEVEEAGGGWAIPPLRPRA